MAKDLWGNSACTYKCKCGREFEPERPLANPAEPKCAVCDNKYPMDGWAANETLEDWLFKSLGLKPRLPKPKRIKR